MTKSKAETNKLKTKSKSSKKPDITKEIDKTVETLLKQLLIEAKVDVVGEENPEDKDKKNYRINISTEESGLLIGHHGETINSLQLLIGVIMYKKLGTWIRVIVDIGDYRKMREESIKEMVNRIIGEVEMTGQPVELPYLSPLERRLVHLMLSDNEKIMSESTGEGRDRRVTIKPR